MIKTIFVAVFIGTGAGVSLAGQGGEVTPVGSGVAVMTGDDRPAFSIGPFELGNPDSTSRLRFQFAGQLRTGYYSRDRGPGKSRTEEISSEARRIRLSLLGSFPKHRLTFKLHLSTAPGSIELMDIHFDYNVWRSHWLRFGQNKIPFTRYRIQSFQRLTFVDWSIVTIYFGAERQMGLALHNGYEKPPAWGYALGLFTGVNALASHAVGLARFFGEATANPSDLADPGPDAEYHPELVAHISHNHGDISVNSDTDEKRGGLRYSAALSAAWDLDPVEFQDPTTRLAAEMLIKYRGASLCGVGYAGFVDLSHPTVRHISRNELQLLGGLAQGAYRFAGRYEISARYAIVDFDDDLVNNAFYRAQNIIAAAEANLAEAEERELAQAYLDEVTSRYKDVGYVYRKEEITLGLNVYFEGHSLKWQNDAGWLLDSRLDEDRVDFVARSQLQLTF